MRKYSVIYFLLIGFFVIFLLMIFSRSIVIPNMNWNSTNGNLAGDPQLYYKVAFEKVHQMQKYGLSAFELRPDSSGPAGIASLIIYFMGHINFVVALNAIMHILSVFCMYGILRHWFAREVALIASLPLFFSTYFLIWFSQINKDSYMILAACLFILYLLRTFKLLESQSSSLKSYILIFAVGIMSIFLFNLIRPYMNQINSICLIICIAVILFKFKKKKYALISFSMLCLLSFNLSTGATSDKTLEQFSGYSQNQISPNTQKQEESLSQKCLRKISYENWKFVQHGTYFEKKLHSMISQRCLIYKDTENQSNQASQFSILDSEVLPTSTWEAIKYLPKAAMNGILAPFPNKWFFNFQNQFSIFYLIVPIETLFYYLGLLLIAFYIFKKKHFDMLIIVLPSFLFMFCYGITIPYIGALYRYRYSWWTMIICLSMAIFIQQIKKIQDDHNTSK